MKIIASLYRRIFDIGVTERLSFGEKLRINLCNQSIALASTLTLVHILLIFFGPTTPYELMISSCWLVIFSTSLYANHTHRYNIANTTIIGGSTLMIGSIHFLYGSMARLEPIYLTIIIIGFFIIKPKYRTFLTIVITVIYCLNSYLYANNIGAPLEEYLVPKASYEYFAFSIIISGSLISKVISENNNYNKVLAIQNNKMVDQNEELKRFNYIISHDLKEPIRSIVGLTGLLEKKNKGLYPDITDQILSLGRRLNNMVDDIVKFQEVDKISVQLDSILLPDLINNIKESLPAELKVKSSQIILSGLTEIISSKTCVYLILKNLIENGIKYNNNKPIIKINCLRNNGNYIIEVIDNGIGIPLEYHDEVFVMFKRLEQLQNKKGTGLGLSISKKLAQKYGAELSIANSHKSEGTIFRLTIPLHVSVMN